MTSEELVDILASHRTIGQAPRDELAWLVTHGTLRRLQPGDVVSRQTEIVDGLHIVLSGRMSIHVNRGSGQRKVMEWQGGDVTGILPYSRLLTPPGDTIVDEPTEVLTIHREALPELIRHCYEVTAILVHVMTDRARRFTSADLRDEKLISLGKLAAGLAHEVNNPASAAMRDVKSLAGTLTEADKAARSLFGAGLTVDQLAELDAVREQFLSAPPQRALAGVALADREDAFAEWLRGHEVDDAVSEDLARSTVTIDALDRLARAFQGGNLDAALRWIAGALSARALVVDIERATTRIHGLVAAVKGFTHMDRAATQEPVDLVAGLEDTVALLEGKARARSVAISLTAPPDLPHVRGLSAEINQVWMNLIDNAIDAAPVSGHVTVTASHEPPHVVVRVTDDGPGIPPEIKGNIFDPFFTTKSVGKGTGLGLDIVRRVIDWHNGEIDVASQPGRTEFSVSLPSLERH